jgi:PAS domain S-box-containing protein
MGTSWTVIQTLIRYEPQRESRSKDGEAGVELLFTARIFSGHTFEKEHKHMSRHEHHKSELQASGHVRRRFLKVATQVSTTIGMDFIRALTKNLAETLEADSVYIGEFVGRPVDRVRTLAVCVDGDAMQNFEFPISGSPEAEVVSGTPCICLRGLQEMFPADLRLSELKAEACVALPLNDSESLGSGLIVALYRRPIREVQFVQSMLTMFVPRVLAELKRKLEEDTLRTNEQRYQAFVGLNPDPMWCIEFNEPIATDLAEDHQLESILQQGYLAECNDALARALGKERAEELIGAKVDVLSPSFYKTFRDATGSLVRSRYRFDTVETSPVDGVGKRRYFLRSHWGIVENGKLQRIWGMNREITQLKESQIALALAERRLSELLETVHLAAIVLNREGALSFCNDYLLRLTGWRAEEIVGKNWFDQMVPIEEREKQRMMFSSRTKTPSHFEGTLLCRDDHRLLVGWDYVVIPDANGRIAGAMSTGRDLTDYTVLETQPRQSRSWAPQS